MDLVPPEKLDLSALRWVRVDDARNHYELMSDEATIARLAWPKQGSSVAEVQTAEGSAVLEHHGFLRTRLALHPAGSPALTARLETRLGGHVVHRIQVGKDETFELRRAGVSVPAWSVTTEAGAEVFHIEPVREGAHLDGGIYEVENSTSQRPGTIVVLAILSWYLIARAWFEDETVAEWSDHAEGRF